MSDQVEAFAKWKTITLDPPWPERGGGKSKRGADRHYPVMSVPAIIDTVVGSKPVMELADDAHCWCWVTDNYLEGGLELMRTMGFRYVRTLAWVKMKAETVYGADCPCDVQDLLQIGLGQYLRGSHELALFGVRGKAMVPPPADRMPSVVFAPRGRHSAKPDEAIRVFERVSPGPRVEMFARTQRPGWGAWGNETSVWVR